MAEMSSSVLNDAYRDDYRVCLIMPFGNIAATTAPRPSHPKTVIAHVYGRFFGAQERTQNGPLISRGRFHMPAIPKKSFSFN